MHHAVKITCKTALLFILILIILGCRPVVITFAPLKHHPIKTNPARIPLKPPDPIDRLITTLQAHAQNTRTQVQYGVVGNSQSSTTPQTPPQTTPNTFNLNAQANIFCIGGICNQQWLRGSAEIFFRPRDKYFSLNQISAQNDARTMHLTGRVERFDNGDPLSLQAETHLVLTAGSSQIVMDTKSTLFVEDDNLADGQARAVFIASSATHGITLDGQVQTQ